MQLRAALAVSLLAACPAPSAKPPVAAPADTTAPPKAACSIEGDGEPLDSILFHEVPELALAAKRDGTPLVRTQGQARYELHGRWTELGTDDRGHLELTRPGALRVEGYARLSAVRFRLRREITIVPEHVFLEKDALVRVVGVAGAMVDIAADVPFDSPRVLATRVGCGDVGYEPIEREYDENGETTGHLSTLRLFDAPQGKLRFEGDVRLMFVREGEKRDGFVRVEGRRYRVRVAGWTPSELVDHTPQGSGYGAGGHKSSRAGARGRAAKVARTTALLVAGGSEAPAKIGELASGTKVVVTKEGAELVPVSLADVVAVDGAALLVRASDLE